MKGSEPELSRVIANLLFNAIRHTPSEGTVTITGGRDDAGGWFAVSDGCGGIPEADLPQVFDLAYRATPSRTPVEPNDGAAAPARVGPAAAWAWRSSAASWRPTTARSG